MPAWRFVLRSHAERGSKRTDVSGFPIVRLGMAPIKSHRDALGSFLKIPDARRRFMDIIGSHGHSIQSAALL